MTRWRILPVTSTALDAVAALHARCFPGENWDGQDFAGVLAMGGASGRWVVDVTDLQQRPIGFLFDLLASPAGEIVTLGIAPEARRHGAARALLADLFVRARARKVGSITLEVAADNAPALILYESLGFARIGLRAGYYRRPDASLMDAHLLRIEIAPAPGAP